MECVNTSKLSKRAKVLYAILLCTTGVFMVLVSIVSLETTSYISTAIRNESTTFTPTFFTKFTKRDSASRRVVNRLFSTKSWPTLDMNTKMAELQNKDRFRLVPNCSKRNTGVEDILCMQRPKFLPHFRNPCWYQDGRLRCLPYFHIIGVCKTGTTDLFMRLINHPYILKNSGALDKELWYWTWHRYGESFFHRQTVPKARLDGFINSFDAEGIERIKINDTTSKGGLYHPAITGHGDPMDFWDQTAWRMIPQNDPDRLLPEVTAPSLIKHVNPGVKLILVLRDPIQRLFSHYLHGHFGTNAAQFHDDVISTVKSVQSCNRTLALKACLYSKDLLKTFKVPISASFYSVHLTEWLRVFPRKQILIIRTEDFSKNVAATLTNIFQFLQIEPLPSEELHRIAQLPHFYSTEAKDHAGSILPATIQILQDVFEPYNRQLATMLNDKNFLWST